MSRNFTSEKVLVDQLLLDDTNAFEEIYHRYCYSLYTYCVNKLHSPEDARRIVRDIFIAMWEQRHTLPVDFSVSLHLYTEVRKAVVKVVDEKLLDQSEVTRIEKQIIPGFAVMQLKQARQPVHKHTSYRSNNHSSLISKEDYENHWWNIQVSLKGIRHTFQQILNFW